jgi:hypothetical protein
LEIILSDDVSSDGRFRILKDVSEKYMGPHKIVLNKNQSNLGLAKHINAVVNLATSKWLVFAAGDDISFPRRTEVCKNLIVTNPDIAAVFTKFIRFKGEISGKTEPPFERYPKIMQTKNYEWLNILMSGDSFCTPGCSALWRKDIVLLFGGLPDCIVAEDVFLGLRALITNCNIGFIDEVMVKYREHGSNICNGANQKLFSRKILQTYIAILNETSLLQKSICDLHDKKIWGKINDYLSRLVIDNLVTTRNDLNRIQKALTVFLCANKETKFQTRLKKMLSICKTR